MQLIRRSWLQLASASAVDVPVQQADASRLAQLYAQARPDPELVLP